MRDGGTMSEFVWLDYSERERRKMLDVVDLFGEHDTRDELCPIPANHESRFRTPRIPVQFPGQAPTEAANLPCLRSSSVEIVHVITIEDSGAHQMCLLQPAQLLAVRAIGEHTLHIALDGDIDEPVNSIEERIARLEYASRTR